MSTPISPAYTREDLIAMIHQRDALVSDLKAVAEAKSRSVEETRATKLLIEISQLRETLIEANNRLIAINHELLNYDDPDWKVLAAARRAAFPSTEGGRHG
jgi:hypothetical protein